MTHSPEFTAYISTHVLELEDDIDAYEKSQQDRYAEIKRLTGVIANLHTEIEAFDDLKANVAGQIAELNKALEDEA